MKISLAMYQCPVYTFGEDACMAIWFQGCKKQCPGCESPSFRSLLPKTDAEPIADEIFKKIRENQVSRVVISGGEPFLQPQALLWLVKRIFGILKSMGISTPDIMIYTGYKIEEIRQMGLGKSILSYISAVVDGEYIEDQNDGKTALRGSKNQRLIILNPALNERYQKYELQGRKHSIEWNETLKRFVYVGIKPKL